MGQCSSSTDDIARTRRNININKQINEDRRAEQRAASCEVRLLLLGTAETGKSTLLKQLKVVHGIPFTDAEISHFRNQIRVNLFQCARDLIKAMHRLRIPFGFDPEIAALTFSSSASGSLASGSSLTLHPQSAGHRKSMDSCNLAQALDDAFDNSTPIITMSQTLPCVHSCNKQSIALDSFNSTLRRHLIPRHPKDALADLATLAYLRAGGETGQHGTAAYAAQFIELMEAPQFHDEAFVVSDLTVEAVKSLWMDTGVQYCMSRGNEFHMMDCCAHFMNSIDQILNVNYIPTNQDIFFMREATNCIQQICFTWRETVFHVFDVGGHRKQRKSWAPYFESVKAIIYVVAISAFDQILPSDEDNANRLVDSLNLFGTVCNHPLFKKTSLILFMNKIDVFKAKLKRSEISSYFPEYQGRNTYHDGCEFFVNLFLDMTKYKENKVYIHFTWATDTRQISKIIHSVNMIIAGSVMRDSEFF
ncbi:hypothetical protein HDU81_009889 [Chytriomyces hyalinus]|nr:hypothetical protein HDU81_009889 [Chytriomyces hyalinus]